MSSIVSSFQEHWFFKSPGHWFFQLVVFLVMLLGTAFIVLFSYISIFETDAWLLDLSIIEVFFLGYFVSSVIRIYKKSSEVALGVGSATRRTIRLSGMVGWFFILLIGIGTWIEFEPDKASQYLYEDSFIINNFHFICWIILLSWGAPRKKEKEKDIINEQNEKQDSEEGAQYGS